MRHPTLATPRCPTAHPMLYHASPGRHPSRTAIGIRLRILSVWALHEDREEGRRVKWEEDGFLKTFPTDWSLLPSTCLRGLTCAVNNWKVRKLTERDWKTSASAYNQTQASWTPSFQWRWAFGTKPVIKHRCVRWIKSSTGFLPFLHYLCGEELILCERWKMM